MGAHRKVSRLQVRLLLRFLAIGVTLCGLIFGPSHAKKLLENVPLVWRPTTQLGGRGPVVEIHREGAVDPGTGRFVSDTTGQLDVGGARTIPLGASPAPRIKVERFSDTRQNPRLIAENREEADEGKILPVTTSDDVGAWCADRLRYILTQMGFDIVEANADIVLSGQVRRFFVAETNTYEGDVGLKIDVQRPDGRLLWSGMANGVADRFGRSYKLENYYEVISDSFLDAAQKLVDHPGFFHILSTGRPSSSADPAASGSPANQANALSPSQLLAEVLKLKEQGFSLEMLVLFVQQQRLSEAFSADDLRAWKDAGVADDLLFAALSRAADSGAP